MHSLRRYADVGFVRSPLHAGVYLYNLASPSGCCAGAGLAHGRVHAGVQLHFCTSLSGCCTGAGLVRGQLHAGMHLHSLAFLSDAGVCVTLVFLLFPMFAGHGPLCWLSVCWVCVSALDGVVCSVGGGWFQATVGVVCCPFLVRGPVCWGSSGGCAVLAWLGGGAGAFADVAVSYAGGGVSASPGVMCAHCSWGHRGVCVSVPGT